MHRVAIVEDHLLTAETLRVALTRTGIAVDVLAPDHPDALVSVLLEARPDLVLLDLDLGEFGDGLCMIAPLTEAGLRVLVVTGTTDRERAAIAFEQGAFGYQSKSAGFGALLAKIDLALEGTAALDSALRSELLVELAHLRADRDHAFAPFRRLTDRERDTLEALSQGRTVSQIAHDWVVSEATVRSHVRAVLGKLDAPNQLAAVTRAMRSGWINGS